MIIGSLIITSIVSLQNITGIRAKFFDIFEISGNQLAKRLSEEVREVTIDLNHLSKNPMLMNESFPKAKQAEILREYVDYSDSKYTDVAIYDLRGNLIIDTTNKTMRENVANEEFFKKALEGNAFFDSQSTTESSANHSGFHFSTPRYDAKGILNGILDIEIPVSFIHNILNESLFYNSEDDKSFMFAVKLLHDNGFLIYDTNSNQTTTLNKDTSDTYQDVNLTRSLLNNGLDAIGDTLTISIPLILGSEIYNSNGNWTLVFEGDLSTIMSNYNKTITNFLISSALILIITIFVTVLSVRKITSPITHLKNSALELSKNNFSKEIMIEGSSEVKDLSISLEVMRRNIENSNKNLTRKVKERTLELEHANEELRMKQSEVNQVNSELRKSTRAKEEFLSMVSHELKTPITPMKLYVEMILRGDKSTNLNVFQKKALNIVYKNILKLETIINDIFTVYKMESDKFHLNKRVTNIKEMIETNAAALRPLMIEKEISFDTIVTTRSNVYCDPTRISQVLFNLVNNAVDHVPNRDGRITIKVEEQSLMEKTNSDKSSPQEMQKRIIFTVEDNGIGIKDENTVGIFKKFYQIDTGLRRKYGGTGLGLAICRGIIESHGGSIWLDPDYKNGARFKFSLEGI